MLDLNSYELAYPTAKLIDDLKHQLMVVVVNTVEELLELVDRQIPYDLSEAFVLLRMSWLLGQTLRRRSRISVLFWLHVNVKSAAYLSVALQKTVIEKANCCYAIR